MNFSLGDFIINLLQNPIFSFLSMAGLTAYIFRDIFRTSNLRQAARSVADFIDEYSKYDAKGAAQLDRALIEYHNEAIKALQENETK